MRVPLRAIRSVSTERYGATGFRLAGTSIPWTDIRAGRFRRGGRWTFLSFDDRDRVLTLELDRTVPGAATTSLRWASTIRPRSPPRSTRDAAPDPRRSAQWMRTVSGAIRRITRSEVIVDSS